MTETREKNYFMRLLNLALSGGSVKHVDGNKLEILAQCTE